jgi:PhnB protein
MSKQPSFDQLDLAITRMLESRDGAGSPADLSTDAELVELLRIGGDLRDMPRPDFKASLKAELERKALMSTKTVEFRKGYHTVTPYLLAPGLEFLDFLKNVFGAEETFRVSPGPGRYHTELRIGDSMVMVGIGAGRAMPASLQIFVPDVDEVHKRALAAGCKELQPASNAHWEPIRLSGVVDPAGNGWSITTHLGGSYIPEGRNTLSAGFTVKGAPQLIEFMKTAFDAKELQRWEWPGGFYASMRIGDSVVGVSEAGNHEWMQPSAAMVYLYVPDCDAVYQQALLAGATSLQAPTNQSYGDRSGGVVDAWGNMWYMATPV